MKQKITFQNGNILSYTDFGEPQGYPILIQHGLIASIEDVDLFERLIQHKYRLISIARPGYGDSSPYEMSSYAEWGEIVSPLVDQLKLSQFDILGMSSGAPYGYALGWKFPEMVRNIFIFSGLPALYDEIVLSQWPYPPIRNQNITEVQMLARQLFFQDLTAGDLKKADIRDSQKNDCFGVAMDLILRFKDWGFSLSDVKARVFMRHSKEDLPFTTAIRTAELLPNCELELTETGPHFSKAALDEFIEHAILGHEHHF